MNDIGVRTGAIYRGS